MVLKRLGVLSVGVMLGGIYAALGLIVGGLFTMISLAGFAASRSKDGGLMALALGVGSVIVIPIFYGVLGFVVGVIMAALYNLVALMFGGVRMEFEQPK